MDLPEVMCIWQDDFDISIPRDNIYENYFEKPFIQDTEKFYQSQEVFHIEHGSILEYLEKVCSFSAFNTSLCLFDRLLFILIRISNIFIHIYSYQHNHN